MYLLFLIINNVLFIWHWDICVFVGNLAIKTNTALNLNELRPLFEFHPFVSLNSVKTIIAIIVMKYCFSHNFHSYINDYEIFTKVLLYWKMMNYQTKYCVWPCLQNWAFQGWSLSLNSFFLLTLLVYETIPVFRSQLTNVYLYKNETHRATI